MTTNEPTEPTNEELAAEIDRLAQDQWNHLASRYITQAAARLRRLDAVERIVKPLLDRGMPNVDLLDDDYAIGIFREGHSTGAYKLAQQIRAALKEEGVGS